MTIEVVPAETKREREAWLRLPWRLYRNDPAWVPNLLMLQREVIDPKKNPFFDHGEAQLFVAKRDGEVVGRISAQIDRLHNERHGEKTGFFGFFECIDDAATAHVLFEAAEGWLRARGMDRMRGPFNLSINEEIGLLIEGFEHPPMIAMTHSLPYYRTLVRVECLKERVEAERFSLPHERKCARLAEYVATGGIVIAVERECVYVYRRGDIFGSERLGVGGQLSVLSRQRGYAVTCPPRCSPPCTMRFNKLSTAKPHRWRRGHQRTLS